MSDLLDYANEDKRKANAKSVRPHLQREVCPHCDAPTVEYRHTLSKQLGELLIQLYRFGGRARVRDLHVGYSKASNFQKLRYWGLVAQEKGSTWYWVITPIGESFVRATLRIQKHVWTYRGVAVETEGDMVLITDLVPDYNTRISYAQEARAHGGVIQ